MLEVFMHMSGLYDFLTYEYKTLMNTNAFVVLNI